MDETEICIVYIQIIQFFNKIPRFVTSSNFKQIQI